MDTHHNEAQKDNRRLKYLTITNQPSPLWSGWSVNTSNHIYSISNMLFVPYLWGQVYKTWNIKSCARAVCLFSLYLSGYELCVWVLCSFSTTAGLLGTSSCTQTIISGLRLLFRIFRLLFPVKKMRVGTFHEWSVIELLQLLLQFILLLFLFCAFSFVQH